MGKSPNKCGTGNDDTLVVLVGERTNFLESSLNTTSAVLFFGLAAGLEKMVQAEFVPDLILYAFFGFSSMFTAAPRTRQCNAAPLARRLAN
jgi:hypothetical protein